MSAEVLRKAAALMRERAEAATPGPWEIRDGYDPTLVQQGSNWPTGDDNGLGQIYNRATAYHIASWNPAVALAVADWLDDIAERHGADPESIELTPHYDEPCPTGECVDGNGHDDCIVCKGCWPSWEGMDWHTVYPCRETKAALKVASAYLGDPR